MIKGTARSSFTLSAIDQSIEYTPVDLSLQVNFLVGSYCQKPVPAGTGFYLKIAGSGLYRATADYKLPACSCYLPSAEKRSYLGFQISEDPDGIILNEELRIKNEELGIECTGEGALAMMHLQEALEAACWQQGNMRQTAPAQRMVDFTRKKLSYDLPASSYSPGLVSSPLHFWMPNFISDRLSKGFQQFGRSSHGFLTNEACMIGMETRTSAPVRIVRDNETLQHITISGLFPCGEGAGYAGGIVSAGVDGERCAEAVANYLGI